MEITETNLIIAGLIQLVIIIVVVSAILKIKKNIYEISKRQLTSYKLRINAFNYLKDGDKEKAILTMTDALFNDLFDALDKGIDIKSNFEKIVINYLFIWSRYFPGESDKIVTQVRDQVLNIKK